MASNILAITSNLLAMASNLLAKHNGAKRCQIDCLELTTELFSLKLLLSELLFYDSLGGQKEKLTGSLVGGHR